MSYAKIGKIPYPLSFMGEGKGEGIAMPTMNATSGPKSAYY